MPLRGVPGDAPRNNVNVVARGRGSVQGIEPPPVRTRRRTPLSSAKSPTRGSLREQDILTLSPPSRHGNHERPSRAGTNPSPPRASLEVLHPMDFAVETARLQRERRLSLLARPAARRTLLPITRVGAGTSLGRASRISVTTTPGSRKASATAFVGSRSESRLTLRARAVSVGT